MSRFLIILSIILVGVGCDKSEDISNENVLDLEILEIQEEVEEVISEDPHPLDGTNFLDSFVNHPIITDYTLSIPEYSYEIPESIIDQEIRDFYIQNVGVYENANSFNESRVYAHFFSIGRTAFDWGQAFIFGKYAKSISYNLEDNQWIYSDSYTVAHENQGIITSDDILTNGPSIERPIFLDVYERKIQDNEGLWDEFDHQALDKEILEDFIYDFFGKLLLEDYEGIKPYLTSEKGFFLGEIEAESLGRNFQILSFDEVQESLQDDNSKLMRELQSMGMNIGYHTHDKFEVLQNAFYSEDIHKVYEVFGGDVYLIECKIDRYNYISFILSMEEEELKLCYLNEDLDLQ